MQLARRSWGCIHRWRAAGSVAVLALALTAVVAVRPAAANAPAPDRRTADFEIRFLEFTIDHHFMGVQMAQLCVQKATLPPPTSDARLKQLCGQIAADQQQEMQQLQTWLKQWYGIDYQPQIRQPGQIQRLQRLEGERFDIEISRMFIQHHERQIRESQRCLDRAFHPELRAFCQHTIEEQSREIQEFRAIIADHRDADDRDRQGGGNGGRR